MFFFQWNIGHFFYKTYNILVLIHGNADVERGFSVNSECLFENFRYVKIENFLIGQRIIYDSVLSVDSIPQIEIIIVWSTQSK